ncbi:hypothetical protein B9Z33_02025 [Limnohabitans sp. T6-20]|nr:hypothetical protein B9Z33_02025 [Limnohabitans sp. T6-20]
MTMSSVFISEADRISHPGNDTVTAPKSFSIQDIYDRIYAAISERRLLPGTKLSEEKLAEVFSTSRTRIREVLMRLNQELIVETHHNRGAFVASPSQEDLHKVFAVRCALERAVVQALAQKFKGQKATSLRQHLALEASARKAGDHATLAHLTGAFHVRLAEATDNHIFADSVRRLVALTGLVIAQFDADQSACPENEHDEIVKAIEAGNATGAEKLLLHHLNHVEKAIQTPEPIEETLDFAVLLGMSVAKSAPSSALSKKRKA